MRKLALIHALAHLLGALLLISLLILFSISKVELFFPISEIVGIAIVCALLGAGYCLWEFCSGIVSVFTGK
jgi:hypothetical protein